MKRFARYVSLILVLTLVLANPLPAKAAADTRSSYYFLSSSTYITRTSSTTFQVWFDVEALDLMDELGASVIKVQKSTDGVNWTTMYTYTSDLYPHLIATNKGTYAGYVTYTGSPGCYYRGFVTYYARKGTGTGKVSHYTSSIIL